MPIRWHSTTNRIYLLTTVRSRAIRFVSLAHRGASPETIPKAERGVASRGRLPREAREVARQALRPGCEELALRIRVMPEPERRPRVKNRHGGAPRGERPASWDARRLASAWYAALWRTPRVFRRAPERLSALRPPLDSGLVKQGCKPRAQKRAAGTRWAV